MSHPDLRETTFRFNDSINSRDLDGLAALMTEDHAFIDTAGRQIQGKTECLRVWRDFFTWFPDYRNTLEKVVVADDMVVMAGRSECSDPRLDGPAIWTARVRDDRLSEWCVYEDTAQNRIVLGID